MSLNFSSIKSITIPDGNVKKIIDSAGRVLWEKASEPAGEIYGVEWDYSQSSTKLTRLESAASFSDPAPAESLTAVGSSPFDDIMPWAGMKKYNIIDGAVAYSEDDEGFNQYADDTMVYIPPFYYKAEKDAENSKWRWYISPTKQNGFELHPGSGRYIGKYHTSTTNKSIAGAAVQTYLPRSSARTKSHDKGSNWWLLDFTTWCAIELLYLVEFANWDSQTVLGTGQDSGSKLNTGQTISAAYHTVKRSKASNQYRNIENLYSNIYTWCDGFVASDRMVYVGLDNSVFDETVTNLVATGITLPSNEYITGYGYSADFPWVFIPDSASGGTSDSYVTDKEFSNSGVCALYVGGYYGTSGIVGLFFLGASNRYTISNAYYGFRLIYIP